MPLELASTNLVQGLLESKYWSTGGLVIMFFNSVKALVVPTSATWLLLLLNPTPQIRHSLVPGLQVGKSFKFIVKMCLYDNAHISVYDIN